MRPDLLSRLLFYITASTILISVSAWGADTDLAGQNPVRFEAKVVDRRSVEGETVLDLFEGASAFQNSTALHATRLRVWMRTDSRDGRRQAVLEIYYEPGTAFVRNGVEETAEKPGILRWTTSTGLAIDAKLAPEDSTASNDPFAERAERFRAEGASFLDVVAPAEKSLEHLQLSAEEMRGEDFTSGQAGLITLYGNAEIIYNQMILRADVMRFRVRREDEGDPKLESVYAEGNVELLREGSLVTARAVTLDIPNLKGIALDARVRLFIPERDVALQFGGDAIRVLSEYQFRIEGHGFATTSEMAEPHYRIQANTIDIERKGELSEEQLPDARVVARDNVLLFESAPLFYWPYLSKNVGANGFLLRRLDLGHSGRRGYYGKATWAVGDLVFLNNDWGDLRLRTDYYSKRGAGVGLDMEYETPSRMGTLRSYYINDYAKEDDRNLPVPRNRRGEVTFHHRERLPEDFDLDLELGYLSDRQFLRTYDRSEYDEGQDRRTSAFLRRPYDNLLFTAQAKSDLNDFQNSVERIGAAFHAIGEPIFSGPILLTSHSDVSRLRLRTDDDLGLANQDPVTRFDNRLEASYPLPLPFALRVDPFVEGTYTAYSRQTTADNNDRASAAYGVRAGTNFYATYNVRNDFLDIDRIRHVVTPTVDYRNVFSVTRGPEYFVQHDEIDARDTMHRTVPGLRNRLQTYRVINGERRIVDFVTLDTDYHFHHRNTGADRDLDDFFEWSASWRMTEYLTLHSNDNRYNTEAGRLDSLHGEAEFHVIPPLSVSAGHLYFVDVTDPALPRHSISTLRITHQPKYSRWRTEFRTSYDFQSHRRPGDLRDPAKLGTGLYLTRQMEGWEVTLGAEFNQGRANEAVFSFQIQPPGRSPWVR